MHGNGPGDLADAVVRSKGRSGYRFRGRRVRLPVGCSEAECCLWAPGLG